MAQGTGQPEFELSLLDENIFQFMPAGLIMEFLPKSKQMVLKQGGGKYTFVKE